MRGLGILLVVVGIIGLVVGVIYITQTAGHLPSFFPGHVANAKGHHTKRGIAALVVGGILVVVGAIMVTRTRSRGRVY
jgi:amino acid permease